MANYVCTTLSDPDVNGLQNCTVWTVETLSTLAITPDQANLLTGKIVLVLIIAYCWVLFKRFADKA